MKIKFYSRANEAHYHKKGFALSLVLKMRVFGTRKWPVCRCPFRIQYRDQMWLGVHTAENIRDPGM